MSRYTGRASDHGTASTRYDTMTSGSHRTSSYGSGSRTDRLGSYISASTSSTSGYGSRMGHAYESVSGRIGTSILPARTASFGRGEPSTTSSVRSGPFSSNITRSRSIPTRSDGFRHTSQSLMPMAEHNVDSSTTSKDASQGFKDSSKHSGHEKTTSHRRDLSSSDKTSSFKRDTESGSHGGLSVGDSSPTLGSFRRLGGNSSSKIFDTALQADSMTEKTELDVDTNVQSHAGLRGSGRCSKNSEGSMEVETSVTVPRDMSVAADSRHNQRRWWRAEAAPSTSNQFTVESEKKAGTYLSDMSSKTVLPSDPSTEPHGSTKHLKQESEKLTDVGHQGKEKNISGSSKLTSATWSWRQRILRTNESKMKQSNMEEEMRSKSRSPEAQQSTSSRQRSCQNSGETRSSLEKSMDATTLQPPNASGKLSVSLEATEAENRAERIAWYKEERRKQLSHIARLTSLSGSERNEADTLLSPFIATKKKEEDLTVSTTKVIDIHVKPDSDSTAVRTDSDNSAVKTTSGNSTVRADVWSDVKNSSEAIQVSLNTVESHSPQKNLSKVQESSTKYLTNSSGETRVVSKTHDVVQNKEVDSAKIKEVLSAELRELSSFKNKALSVQNIKVSSTENTEASSSKNKEISSVEHNETFATRATLPSSDDTMDVDIETPSSLKQVSQKMSLAPAQRKLTTAPKIPFNSSHSDVGQSGTGQSGTGQSSSGKILTARSSTTSTGKASSAKTPTKPSITKDSRLTSSTRSSAAKEVHLSSRYSSSSDSSRESPSKVSRLPNVNLTASLNAKNQSKIKQALISEQHTKDSESDAKTRENLQPENDGETHDIKSLPRKSVATTHANFGNTSPDTPRKQETDSSKSTPKSITVAQLSASSLSSSLSLRSTVKDSGIGSPGLFTSSFSTSRSVEKDTTTSKVGTRLGRLSRLPRTPHVDVTSSSSSREGSEEKQVFLAAERELPLPSPVQSHDSHQQTGSTEEFSGVGVNMVPTTLRDSKLLITPSDEKKQNIVAKVVLEENSVKHLTSIKKRSGSEKSNSGSKSEKKAAQYSLSHKNTSLQSRESVKVVPIKTSLQSGGDVKSPHIDPYLHSSQFVKIIPTDTSLQSSHSITLANTDMLLQSPETVTLVPTDTSSHSLQSPNFINEDSGGLSLTPSGLDDILAKNVEFLSSDEDICLNISGVLNEQPLDFERREPRLGSSLKRRAAFRLASGLNSREDIFISDRESKEEEPKIKTSPTDITATITLPAVGDITSAPGNSTFGQRDRLEEGQLLQISSLSADATAVTSQQVSEGWSVVTQKERGQKDEPVDTSKENDVLQSASSSAPSSGEPERRAFWDKSQLRKSQQNKAETKGHGSSSSIRRKDKEAEVNTAQKTGQSHGSLHGAMPQSRLIELECASLASKVSSVRTKFDPDAAGEKSKPQLAEEKSLKGSHSTQRGKDFQQLLEKFSSSDTSSSDRSDSDSHVHRRQIGNQKPDTKDFLTISDDRSRQMPERTQSLKVSDASSRQHESEGKGVERTQSLKVSDASSRQHESEGKGVERTQSLKVSDASSRQHESEGKGVERTQSLKVSDASSRQHESEGKGVERTQSLKVSDASSRQHESEGKGLEHTPNLKVSDFFSRRQKNEGKGVEHASSFQTEVKEKIFEPEVVDRELLTVLSRRHQEVDQQLKQEDISSDWRGDQRLGRADNFKESKVEDIIADPEVAKILKARRLETDTKTDTERRPEANTDTGITSQSGRSTSDKNVEVSLPELQHGKQFEKGKGLHLGKELDKRKELDKEKSSYQANRQLTHSAIEDKTALNFRHDETSLTVHQDIFEPTVCQDTSVMTKDTHQLSTDVKTYLTPLSLDHTASCHVSIEVKADEASIPEEYTIASFTVPLSGGDTKNLETGVSLESTELTKKSVHNTVSTWQESSSHGVSGISLDKEKKEIEVPPETQTSRGSRLLGKEKDIVLKAKSNDISTTVTLPTVTCPTTGEGTSPPVLNNESKYVTTSQQRGVHSLISTSTGVRRAESFKEQSLSLSNTESLERKKGILKRSPSLNKYEATTPIMDPQLAKIMEQRRQKELELEAAKEEDEARVPEPKPDPRRQRALSAAEEIEENIRQMREAQNKTQQSEEESELCLSVSERIFKLKAKLEEQSISPISKPHSGATSPKSAKPWSGTVTPRKQQSVDEGVPDVTTEVKATMQAEVSRVQLVDRLTTLAEKSEEFQERRHKFQRRQRDDWRTRTQPVTHDEILEADSLDSVSAFRALVRRNAMKNVFEQLKTHDQSHPLRTKASEFPQHIVSETRRRRGRQQRHNTLPVTAEELNAIPESEPPTPISLSPDARYRDSRTDSGILSGSDADLLPSESLRSLSLEMDVPENDPACMSVMSKTSLFRSLDEKVRAEKEKSASGAKRYIDRKKRERSRTQPVTDDEVKTAAEFADEKRPIPTPVKLPQPEVVNRPKSPSNQPPEEEQEDHLIKLSLAEKVKLFTVQQELQTTSKQPKADIPAPRRRPRKMSRFNTQPVTPEELEKATRFSPLAMSLVKPPDPELLMTLPLKGQQELMRLHAEATLSQCSSRSGSRSSSQPGSRRGSFTTPDTLTGCQETVVAITGETTSVSSTSQKDSTNSIQIAASDTDTEYRGILKKKKSAEMITSEVISSQDLPISATTTTVTVVTTTEDIMTSSQRGADGDRASPIPDLVLFLPEGIADQQKSLQTAVFYLENDDIESESSTDPVPSSDTGSQLIPHADLGLESQNPVLASDDKSVPTTDTKRKSRAVERRAKTDRYLTQPALERSPERSPQRKYKYEGRHMTQPITHDEMTEAEAATTPVVNGSGGSIAERLNQLKTSGEESWKKRVNKEDIVDPDTPNIKLLTKRSLTPVRPSTIADRLTKLEVSSESWKVRVEETDAKRFTVASKISKTIVESPLVAKLRASKKDLTKLDDNSAGNSPVHSPTTPIKEFLPRIPLPKEIVAGPSLGKGLDNALDLSANNSNQSDAERTEVASPVRVAVPSVDHGKIEEFFSSKNIKQITEKFDVNVDDFDNIFIEANEILPSMRKIRPARKKKASSRNPLKTMSQFVEVQTEYIQINTGAAEREMRRLKTEGFARDAGFAQAALAGLASKENFSKVELRKTEPSSLPTTRHSPFSDLMLLHVKGRRNVQTRLVEASSRSMNAGDCYILVTPERVINWVGEFSNIIEKAKSSDIASYIQQKRDLCYKSAAVAATVEQSKDHLGFGKNFWSALSGTKECQACGPDEEDELYESSIVKTNMVYRLVKNTLQPYEQYWGAPLRYEMLNEKEVLVFDFGAEFYVWQGKAVTMEQRKQGMALARILWDKGYDYSQCAINPISPLRPEEDGGLPSKAPKRPDWAIFGKINQNMETILFREKFADWPDTSRLIGVKGQKSTELKSEFVDIKAYDAKRMIPVNNDPVTLILEGAHVGRGKKWQEDMQGFIKEQDILTLGVKVWHVLEYDHFALAETSYGQFHDGDTYVVRWQYMITNAGMRSLKGHAARHSLTGRERCAYFFWQGKNSTINEKGASALMTVELDEERGPQVRVVQGKEPPCFLNLFEGHMIVHIGKREDESTNTPGPWRLYTLRGDDSGELCLLEIPLTIANFRSRSSSVLLNVKTGITYVWHGCKSPEHIRRLVVEAVKTLKKNRPQELDLHPDAHIVITEIEEGHEKLEIWSAVGSHDRALYHSLLSDKAVYDYTPRLFYMTSVSMVFEVMEQMNPARIPDLTTPFPFFQSDLYKASQPALFLMDAGSVVFLWQGWWPLGSEEAENVHTGSAIARYNTDRRCAMETTLQYCKEKKHKGVVPEAFLVCAGVEPLAFQNLFPFWEHDTAVCNQAKQEGKALGYCERIKDVYTKLTQTRYTLQELQERPLPDGVDPLKLESYLSDEEFEEVMDMKKEEFYNLPAWKQSQVKQSLGLF